MRSIVWASVVVVFSAVLSAGAQQPNPPNTPVSVESARIALQKSQQPSLWVPTVPPWIAPGPMRWGILTFTPPDTNGEMVKIGIPVGKLVSSAAQAISNAHNRRAERKAQDEVQRALQDFQAQSIAR